MIFKKELAAMGATVGEDLGARSPELEIIVSSDSPKTSEIHVLSSAMLTYPTPDLSDRVCLQVIL